MVTARVTMEKQSFYLAPWDNGKQCTCNHAITKAVLGQLRAFTLRSFVYLSFTLFYHNIIEIDTPISVIVVSPTTWEARPSPSGWGELPSWFYDKMNLGSSPQASIFALGLWWRSQVVGDTMTSSQYQLQKRFIKRDMTEILIKCLTDLGRDHLHVHACWPSLSG